MYAKSKISSTYGETPSRIDVKNNDNDLYEDFDNSSHVHGTSGSIYSLGTPGTSSLSRNMMTGTGSRLTGTALHGNRFALAQIGTRLNTTSRGSTGEVRPMTSVAGAGYHSKRASALAFDPLNQGRGPAPPLEEKMNNSTEDMAKEMERQVHALIEESAEASLMGNHELSLEKAKEANKRDKALCKYRERNSKSDQINYELSYAVALCIATSYSKNGMQKEALQEYSQIVRCRNYPQAGRLRLNMGNIYFEQKNYFEAIKCYRMAHDQIPQSGNAMRMKIFRNIGNAFVRMNQFHDAIGAYEKVMYESPDVLTGFDLVLCYYALEDIVQMKKSFQRLVAIPIKGAIVDDEEEDDIVGNKKSDEDKLSNDFEFGNVLKIYYEKRKKEANRHILTVAKLIAPILDPQDWAAGYIWIIDTLFNNHKELASQMEIEKALKHLHMQEFDKAIEMLKAFKKKEPALRTMAATNLSFIYFLEGDFKEANLYADLAVRADRYNAKALVNKGNCFFVEQDLERAREMYLEAIGVEVGCVEAIFNLGLTNIQLGLIEDALRVFEKLHTMLPTSSEVIYHIANLHDKGRDDKDAASKWFNVLLARVPTDPGALSRMGQICNRQDDDTQAYHYHLESYRHYPVNLDVISWLGVWYVKSELYEKAIPFFERASQIQPEEVKWRLMVTSCYRRMGAFQKALEHYERIHVDYPNSIECLRYLIAICKDLGRPYDAYQQKLATLDQSGGSVRGNTLVTREVTGGPDKGVRSMDTRTNSTTSESKNHRAHVDSTASRKYVKPEETDFGDANVDDLLA